MLLGEAPGSIRPMPRFNDDIRCLIGLTESDRPPRQLYRAKHALAFFVIGDKSGSGKGVAVVEQYGMTTDWQILSGDMFLWFHI